MNSEDRGRSRRGCLPAVIIAGGAVLVVAAWAAIVLARGARDPTSTAYQLLAVIRGEKGTELAVTEIIVDRLARKAGVPADETAALKRELVPISEELPRLSEGEKEKLAMLIRGSIEDGRLTDDEIAAIRDYSYRSARDGNAKP
ncbi:MAG TPA: hypothetical protein VMW93_08960 [bacterium]|nr:hypothetical protein [bacterium]